MHSELPQPPGHRAGRRGWPSYVASLRAPRGHAVGRGPQHLERSWGWGDPPCLTGLCGQMSCSARWSIYAPRPPVPEVCTQVDSTWARPEAKVWKRVENQADLRGSRDSKARLQRSQEAMCTGPCADWCWGAHLGWALGLLGQGGWPGPALTEGLPLCPQGAEVGLMGAPRFSRPSPGSWVWPSGYLGPRACHSRAWQRDRETLGCSPI